MDVNGTKFHLLLTRDDWANGTSGQSGETLREIWNREDAGETVAEQEFSWDETANEITLQKRIFKFTAASKDEKPKLENRRGAARDRYGNWYWIDETGSKIKVFSIGSKTVSDFYPSPVNVSDEAKPGAFEPVEKSEPPTVSLRGIAVTIDHFLVAGTIEPAGLLVFDLFAGGEPRRVSWRDDLAFAPFDIAARRGGGVVVLDRENKRFWTLDRGFNALGGVSGESQETDFQPVDEKEERKSGLKANDDDYFANLDALNDPVAIEALPDDTVLILDSPVEAEDFSPVFRFYRGALLDKLETRGILSKVDEEERDKLSQSERFRLRGYDFAFLDAGETDARDRLFIVSEEGNQAFPFRLVCRGDSDFQTSPPLPPTVISKNFELQPIAEYFPLRLYGGKGFAAADDKIYYDFGDRWLPLTKQNRPTFEMQGTLDSPVFDGKEPNCVWHRLMLDGCIPPETKIEVYSLSAESEKDLSLKTWERDAQREPKLYLRANGSELPFAAGKTSREKGSGTWELLFQNAKNRYLKLRLVFSGNGQRTPRVSALRVYYPRFSYLENYLPAIYREDEQSASFLDRFLANFEGFYTSIEDRIAAAEMLFDVRSAPADALEWLGDWLGVALDPAWSEEKRRLFISRAVDFFQYRGTMRGLRIALRLALDRCADESIFDAQTPEEKRLDPIRIVERFQTRRTPEIIPSETTANQNQPRLIELTQRWKPSQSLDVLNRRYGDKNDTKVALKFPLVRPEIEEQAGIWERFAYEAFGFVPSDSASRERTHWQNFLRDQYRDNLALLNYYHRTAYKNFNQIFLPRGTETNPYLVSDWQEFVEKTTKTSRVRKLWQDFLARRYQRIGRLNEIYGTDWDSFLYVSLFDQMPALEKAAGDWLQFESGVLPMHATAHRFTVMIPAILDGGKAESLEEQTRKLELVRRVIELEKPAHTIFDFRFYWNLFRLDEIRLGYDTLLGLGSRDPLLNPELILGQNFIGESRIGTNQPEKYSERYVLENEF